MIPKIAHGDPFQSTATHATAPTVTVTGVAGKSHYLTDLSVSSDKAGSILLVKDGTTVIWQVQVGASFYTHHFEVPIKASVGADLVITIDSTSAGKANAGGVTL